MPLLTMQADPDQDPERLHALIRRAQSQSTEAVLVVYKRRTARIYYEGEKPPLAEKPRG